MIYLVECDFSDPVQEVQWNDFYDRVKLPALLSVAGFHSSQRFKALGRGCPAYLAMHSVEGGDVLLGEDYRSKGGGDFAGWQPFIHNWRRNLYAGVDVAPLVDGRELLLLSESGPECLLSLGLSPRLLSAVALDGAPGRRWLAKSTPGAIPADALPEGVHRYEPLTSRLTPALTARQGRRHDA